MKKALIFFLATAAVVSARASYLNWQITADTPLVDGVSSMDYTYARLVATDGKGNTYSQLAELEKENKQMDAYRSLDLSSLVGGPSAYSFFVELGTYSSSTFTSMASNGGAPVSYDDLATDGYIYEGNMSSVPFASIWHGGPSAVVPEPTSGLMLLLGAAMLGLRRKNRSVA